MSLPADDALPLLVLTGASGYIGSQIIALMKLRWQGRILLVSREPEKLRQHYPDIAAADYAAMANADLSGATVIHMAARNNDRPGSREEFDAANVELAVATAKAARAAGAVRFINLCSTHAIAPKTDDFYGESKSVGARALAEYWPEGVINLYLPAVYGDRLQGKLGKLNALPSPLRKVALHLLAQLKPMVAFTTLFEKLVHLAACPSNPDDPYWTSQYLADPVPANGLYAFGKRTLDLAASLFILTLLSWLLLIVFVYVRLDSKGPGIFAQPRVGRDGKIFTCYKFRTMAAGTRQAASHDVSAAFVTEAGKFLRRTKLDELPQAWNVLKGEMSLVGPRPCLPIQTELIARRDARGVLRMKPGITGLAQVHDIDMSNPALLAAWDSRYLAYRNLLLDMLLLIRTALGGGGGDRVAIETTA